MVSTILVFGLISGVLLLVGFIALLFTDFENPISFFIFICGCLIALVIAGINIKGHIDTESEIIETESTESYTEDLSDLNVFKTNTESKAAIEEEFPEKVDSNTEITEVVTETSETVVNETENIIAEKDDSETEEESIVTLDLVTILRIIAVILLVISMFIIPFESGFRVFMTGFIMIAASAFIEAGKGFIIPTVIMVIFTILVSFGSSILDKLIIKKEKAAKTEQDEMGFSEESFSNAATEKKTLKNLAASDSKVEYILWAVNYLDENGKADNTRKLKNYYIPEILKAQAQFKKIKSFGMDEMTTEAKKHYKKIISLTYSVAKAEVKKAASEILMDMDCNADVCEDIYKKDGYSSMREEIEKNNSEKHMSEKKKEQTLHAKTISKDTYVFWTSEE